MSDFRKNMHIQYKKTLCNIIVKFLSSLGENMEVFSIDPEAFIATWVDSNCLPMGDFSKEEAMKELDAWQGESS